jgi:hypothetical protein
MIAPDPMCTSTHEGKLEGNQRRHHREQRALEGTAHTTQNGRGAAASSNLGGPQNRAGPPVTQQRTPHVDAIVDSGCNQHLLKDLGLFVMLDRKRVMPSFVVASDCTTTPQGYGTARFGVTDEQGSQLTVTLPGCYLDETLPFNLLSVSQLLDAGTISNPDFARRELHLLDCPDFVDAGSRTRTVPMSSENGLYNLRLTPLPRLVAQTGSGGLPQPVTKLREPMQVILETRGAVD